MEQVIKKLEKHIIKLLEEGDIEGANNQLDKLVAISEPILPEIVKEG